MAVVDIATFITDVKDLAGDYGFHVHDERHFVETYSMRQAWEVDLHPANACGGPLDIHMALEVDPRVMLAFEDELVELPEGADPPEGHELQMSFTWALPPLPHGPDLLVLATDLAGVGGADLPLEVSAVDAYAAVTDAPERTLSITTHVPVPLGQIHLNHQHLDEILERVRDVSEYLLDRAPVWLGDL